MKRKILGAIALVAVAAVAAWNVNLDTKSNDLSAASLANIEALAADTESNNNGGVEEITQKDAGRETFYYDGQTNNCHKRTITCKGTGTLQCPPYSVIYDDCCPV